MANAEPKRRLIVDSHVHMWKAASAERPWVPGIQPQLAEPFTIERVVPLMDEAGVDRVIIVPPALDGDRLDYAQEAVLRYPDRFAIMGCVSLSDPPAARRFPTWRQQRGVLGIRLNIRGDDAGLLNDGGAEWFWSAAQAAALPVMFLTTGQMHLFAPIAERHPQLFLIIDHMGVSSQAVKENAIAAAIDQTLALAKYPNVSVKLSSAPHHSAEPYPYRDLKDYIRRLFDAYGPRRCYWGTDITNSFAKASYHQRITHFTEELEFLSEEDKDWIMGRAIVERLAWK
jgi:predicted TIM-barrel fold metal-dependent hydrolase